MYRLDCIVNTPPSHSRIVNKPLRLRTYGVWFPTNTYWMDKPQVLVADVDGWVHETPLSAFIFTLVSSQ